jgi:hypothetical protein
MDTNIKKQDKRTDLIPASLNKREEIAGLSIKKRRKCK